MIAITIEIKNNCLNCFEQPSNKVKPFSDKMFNNYYINRIEEKNNAMKNNVK